MLGFSPQVFWQRELENKTKALGCTKCWPMRFSNIRTPWKDALVHNTNRAFDTRITQLQIYTNYILSLLVNVINIRLCVVFTEGGCYDQLIRSHRTTRQACTLCLTFFLSIKWYMYFEWDKVNTSTCIWWAVFIQYSKT